MPRKTKEPKELEKENQSKVVTKQTKTSATASKKKETTKKETPTKKTTKSASAKKTVATRTKKTTTTKKTTSKKSTSKKATTSSKKQVDIVEYYDLPYRYNQTVVKVLAQTPTNLFIYWDISDKDKKNFEKQYGDRFFETTRPILIVYNDTLNYHFEVEINDFANSWYLHVADSKCDYRIELGRRPIVKTEKINVDYIYITTSNEIESPNDRMLFDKNQKMVYFRNIKTGQQTAKELTSISFIRNMGKIYNIYDLYKVMYQDENIEEIFNHSNPSSGNPSSGSLSSKFK
ncbi:MAG: DUF4912 domain-containing protein [Clostridia bacterium]|nr:DUF4912 domain-containing protein [Clostridia bacterium]